MTLLSRWNARRIAAARQREAERETLIAAAKTEWLRVETIAMHNAMHNGCVDKANTIRARIRTAAPGAAR
jgi:hypothetical protein